MAIIEEIEKTKQVTPDQARIIEIFTNSRLNEESQIPQSQITWWDMNEAEKTLCALIIFQTQQIIKEGITVELTGKQSLLKSIGWLKTYLIAYKKRTQEVYSFRGEIQVVIGDQRFDLR